MSWQLLLRDAAAELPGGVLISGIAGSPGGTATGGNLQDRTTEQVVRCALNQLFTAMQTCQLYHTPETTVTPAKALCQNNEVRTQPATGNHVARSRFSLRAHT